MVSNGPSVLKVISGPGLVRLKLVKELTERGGRKVAEGNNTTIKLTDQQTNQQQKREKKHGQAATAPACDT